MGSARQTVIGSRKAATRLVLSAEAFLVVVMADLFWASGLFSMLARVIASNSKALLHGLMRKTTAPSRRICQWDMVGPGWAGFNHTLV
jgi:hypothetical protein